MNDKWLKTSIVLGTLCVVGYVLAFLVVRQSVPQLSHAVIVFLCSCGIVAGAKVCYIVLRLDLPLALQAVAVYIFVGGVATIWVSLVTICAVFRGVR